MPETVRAVEEAYGNLEATLPVAVKLVAVGVEVAMTEPFASVERSALAMLVMAWLAVVAYIGRASCMVRR